MLEDTDHGVVLNGQIKYGPSATHKSKNSECSDIDEDVNESAKENGEHLCNRDIESFFVKLGFVFTEEKLKIAVCALDPFVTQAERYLIVNILSSR